MSKASIDSQVESILFGSEFGDGGLRAAMGAELRQKLVDAETSGRPLRVYAGYDPSRPDLHLGHSITMRKLRLFQDLGHDVTFLVGSFTAQIGDTSDKLTGRPRLTEEQVLESGRTYAEQAYSILDRARTAIAYNHEWLGKLTMTDVVSLASSFTVQQFLTRDNYRKRLAANSPVGLHEFLYALMQGYDAVHLRADVQIGASEQLFNIMAGRKLQEVFGQRPCVCVTYPILVGTDGKARMSKSAGNTIGLAEAPEEQFGKTMSITDETMLEWVKYVTRWPVDKIETVSRGVREGTLHPMELKKELAREIVTMYHGEEAAARALQHFQSVHQQKRQPDEMTELALAAPTPIIDILAGLEGVKSRSDARRLIEGKGVKLDGEPVERIDLVVSRSCVLQVGKRRFVRIRFA